MCQTIFRAAVALLTSIFVMTLAASVALAHPIGFVVLDFDTDSDGIPIVPGDGTRLNVTQRFLGYGVELDVKDQVEPSNSPLVVYNSDCGPGISGVGCTGGDGDLATGSIFDTEPEGNVLIIQDRNRPLSNPGDDLNGGTIQFLFTDESGVTLESIGVLDLDLTGPPPQEPEMLPTFTVFQLLDGARIETVFGPGDPAVIVTHENPSYPNDNSLRTFDFVPTLSNVLQVDVGVIGDTGAITEIAYTRVPEPTAGAILLLGIMAMLLRRKNS